MQYFIAIVYVVCFAEYVNATDGNLMSRGRGSSFTRRGGGHSSIQEHVTDALAGPFAHSRGGRGNGILRPSPPTYDERWRQQSTLLSDIHTQRDDAWHLFQAVQARVGHLSANPTLYGAPGEWQALDLHRYDHYGHTIALTDRATMLATAQNLSLHNLSVLVGWIRFSIDRVNLSASYSHPEYWSCVRHHLVNADVCVCQGIDAIVASFNVNNTARQSSTEDHDSVTTVAQIAESATPISFATPASSLKSVVSVQDVAVQTTGDGNPVDPTVIAIETPVIVVVTDDQTTTSDSCLTTVLGKKKSIPQKSNSRVQKEWRTVPARSPLVVNHASRAEAQPASRLSVTTKAEQGQQQEPEQKKITASIAKKTKQGLQESEQKKAAAFAKILQEVQDGTAKVTEKEQQIEGAKIKLQSLLKKAVTKSQKSELQQRIAEMDKFLRKFSGVLKAIDSAASKDSKQLHDLKRDVSALLSEMDAEMQLIPGLFLNMEKDIATANLRRLLEPFVSNLTRMQGDLARLRKICCYEQPKEFFKLDVSSHSPYQVVLEALQEKLSQFLTITDPPLEAITEFMQFVQEHSSQKYTKYYDKQLSLFADSKRYCEHVMQSIKLHYQERGSYPEFLRNEQGRMLAFPGIDHYRSTLETLATKEQSLKTSHTQWSEYSASLVKVLQDMKVALETSTLPQAV